MATPCPASQAQRLRPGRRGSRACPQHRNGAPRDRIHSSVGSKPPGNRPEALPSVGGHPLGAPIPWLWRRISRAFCCRSKTNECCARSVCYWSPSPAPAIGGAGDDPFPGCHFGRHHAGRPQDGGEPNGIARSGRSAKRWEGSSYPAYPTALWRNFIQHEGSSAWFGRALASPNRAAPRPAASGARLPRRTLEPARKAYGPARVAAGLLGSCFSSGRLRLRRPPGWPLPTTTDRAARATPRDPIRRPPRPGLRGFRRGRTPTWKGRVTNTSTLAEHSGVPKARPASPRGLSYGSGQRPGR